mmetsp:Transcript_6709/g.27355  ORF Transcript_6709/g.27355 Transcript_6709/m.27355 type:complete len:329 (-) Transcript_6709:1265-2251(-)
MRTPPVVLAQRHRALICYTPTPPRPPCSRSRHPPPSAPPRRRMSTSKDSAEEATATQRRAQATWRQWPTMLDAVVALRGEADLDGGGCPGAPFSAPLAAVDMGCGTGEVAALLRARGWDPVVGVDGDPAMLDAAEAAHTGVRFVRHDLRGLSLAALGLERPADLIWSSFAVQYFGAEMEPLLRSWASLLRPGGLLAVVETDGLFSCHEPQADGGAEEFRRMERALAEGHGYDAFAGRAVADAMRSAGLEVVLQSDWTDAELAFDGPASPEVLEAWRGRLERMKFPAEYFGDALPARAAAFLECLRSPEHRTSSRLKLVVGRRRGASKA